MLRFTLVLLVFHSKGFLSLPPLWDEGISQMLSRNQLCLPNHLVQESHLRPICNQVLVKAMETQVLSVSLKPISWFQCLFLKHENIKRLIVPIFPSWT